MDSSTRTVADGAIKVTRMGEVEVAAFPCRSDNYGYLMRDEASGLVACIDVPEAAQAKATLDRLGWTLTHVLITHHHQDHVEGVDEMRGEGVTVVGSKADARRLPKLDEQVTPGGGFRWGEREIRVIDTPGHTVGQVNYHLPDPGILFSADTLFAMGCGRVFEGTAMQMWESLAKLKALPETTMVFFGHEYTAANGAFALDIEPENPALLERIERTAEVLRSGGYTTPTNMGEEGRTNPFLRSDTAGVARAVGLVGADAPTVFAEVRRRKDNA